MYAFMILSPSSVHSCLSLNRPTVHLESSNNQDTAQGVVIHPLQPPYNVKSTKSKSNGMPVATETVHTEKYKLVLIYILMVT